MNRFLLALCIACALAQTPCIPSGNAVFTLFAGQTIDAGTVTVEIVDDDVVITYNTENGWELTETHVWAGTSISELPQTRSGNPRIGRFPYGDDMLPAGTTTWSVSIPIDDVGFTCADSQFFVAAHAALRRDDGNGGYDTETGWADGDRFVERGSWATFSTVDLSCDCDETTSEGGGSSCETAFATTDDGSNCFLDLDTGENDVFNRWGWTIGPISDGHDSTYDVYAAAGQCNIGNGVLVGELQIQYSGGVATLTQNLDFPYTMDELQAYAGNEVLPRDVNGDFTVAPGQYPENQDLSDATTTTATFTGLSGDIYVVVHSVVCGLEDD